MQAPPVRELFMQPAMSVFYRRDVFAHGIAGVTIIRYFDAVELHRPAGIKALNQQLLNFTGNPPVNIIELSLIRQYQRISDHLMVERHQLFIIQQKYLVL